MNELEGLIFHKVRFKDEGSFDDFIVGAGDIKVGDYFYIEEEDGSLMYDGTILECTKTLDDNGDHVSALTTEYIVTDSTLLDQTTPTDTLH